MSPLIKSPLSTPAKPKHTKLILPQTLIVNSQLFNSLPKTILIGVVVASVSCTEM